MAVVLILNGLSSLLYFLYWAWKKKEVKRAGIVALFILIIPVVGAVFLIGAELVNIVFFHKKKAKLSEDELGFSKKRERMIVGNDIEKEKNTVPIDEALRISNNIDKRQMLLEILKREDTDNYIEGFQMAMEQSDTEVVHYAAAYISDTIVKYKESEKQLRARCEKDREDNPKIISEYLGLCGDILEKNIFTGIEQKMYADNYEKYLEFLYNKAWQEVDGRKIERMIALKKQEKNDAGVKKWIIRAERILETDIDAAKAVLKYYFYIKDYTKFRNVLEVIRKSDLKLDSELVGWIRFYAIDRGRL